MLVKLLYSLPRRSPGCALGASSDDDNEIAEELAEVVWFAELGEPKKREYLIEQIGVKGYPIVAFGAGGVAKSFAMLSGEFQLPAPPV